MMIAPAIRKFTLAMASVAVMARAGVGMAAADEGHWRHGGHGRHEGWHHHGYGGPVIVAPGPYAYAPPPVIVAPPPAVIVAPPPAMIVAPPPAGLNVIVPIHIR